MLSIPRIIVNPYLLIFLGIYMIIFSIFIGSLAHKVKVTLLNQLINFHKQLNKRKKTFIECYLVIILPSTLYRFIGR